MQGKDYLIEYMSLPECKKWAKNHKKFFGGTGNIKEFLGRNFYSFKKKWWV